MSRLGIRFAIEALFLLAVAVAVGFAHLEAKWIVLIMVGAWLLCALVELIAAKPQFLRDWRRNFVRAPRPATAGGPPAAEPMSATPVAPEAAPEAAATGAAAGAAVAAPKKPSFWNRLTSRKPKPAGAAAAGAGAAASAKQTAEPVPKPTPRRVSEPESARTPVTPAPEPPPPPPEREPERAPGRAA